MSSENLQCKQNRQVNSANWTDVWLPHWRNEQNMWDVICSKATIIKRNCGFQNKYCSFGCSKQGKMDKTQISLVHTVISVIVGFTHPIFMLPTGLLIQNACHYQAFYYMEFERITLILIFIQLCHKSNVPIFSLAHPNVCTQWSKRSLPHLLVYSRPV